jgi:hypothetical protein
MMQQGTPMPGLPVAGSANATGDPYEYGQFQNFLPDVKSEGPNDMATGLRPDMFQYKKPNPGGGTLRDTLAQAVAGGDAVGAGAAGSAGAGGASPVGTMGLGGGGAPMGTTLAAPIGADRGGAPSGIYNLPGNISDYAMGGGPFANGLAPPPGAQQLPTPPGGWVTPYPVQVNTNSGSPTDWRSKG